MAGNELVIREAQPGDEAQWRALWQSYLEFYEAELADEVTAQTWGRILAPNVPLVAIVAERHHALEGFAVCVLHEATWSVTPVCYLEDLFVAPATQGQGTGRALVAALLAKAAAQGWARVYWHTKADNKTARRLYDQFSAADDFVRYRVTPR